MVFGLDKNLMVNSALNEEKNHLFYFGCCKSFETTSDNISQGEDGRKSAREIEKSISLR